MIVEVEKLNYLMIGEILVVAHTGLACESVDDVNYLPA